MLKTFVESQIIAKTPFLPISFNLFESILSPINADLNFPNYKIKKKSEDGCCPFQVDYVDGFSMLLNRNKFINDIYFDERFFLYLENKDIGESFKISSIKLPEGVTPTIQGRDFVVATLAAPTIIKEPEKPVEETAEGEEGVEEGEVKAAEGEEGDVKTAEGDKKEDDKKEGDKKEGDKKEGDKSKKSPLEKK